MIISRRVAIVAAVSSVCFLAYAGPAHAQIRGLYPPGMNATNSGVLPEAGLTYVALVQPYTFDELKAPDGDPLPVTLTTSVFVEQNLFMWVSDFKILGGSFVVPERKINIGVRYLKEFANEATVEGHSLQITAAVTF